MSHERNVRVLIADDHPVVRAGVLALVNDVGHLHSAGEVERIDDVIDLVREVRPDVVVLDLHFGRRSALSLIEDIARDFPECAVLVFSMSTDVATVREAYRRGARGFVVKTRSPSELLEAIENVSAGGTYTSPELGRMLADARGSSDDVALSDLTPRQREVFRCCAEGLTMSEVADRLQISPRTVEVHRAQMMRRLNVSNQTELVLLAVRLGVIEA